MWTVIGQPSIERRTTRGGTNYVLRYPCKCECGTKRLVRAFKLLANSRSCGCNRSESLSKSKTIHGFNKVGKRRRLYRTWDAMIQRCTNPNHSNFHLYGGRGIRVCKLWQDSFVEFMKWALKSGHSNSLQIDRIDNDSGYHPGNCRWVKCCDNLRNRRTNFLITAFGETKCATDWALDPRCHITPSTLRYRLHKLKMPSEMAISTPRRTYKSAERFRGNHIK